MKLTYTETFKVMMIFALVGTLFFFTGWIRFGFALIILSVILFIVTVILWLKWLFNF